jgi:hypothetical protein
VAEELDGEIVEEPEAPTVPVEHPVLRGCVEDPEMVGVPIEAGTPSHTVETVVGVTASGCVIAAWAYDTLYVSRDDGTTFAEVLASGENVGDVAIGGDGTVYALREPGTIAIARPDGTEVYRELPADMDRLVAAGRWLAGIAGATVATSDDAGMTWRFRAFPTTQWPDSDALDVSIEPDGTVRVVAVDEDETILRIASPGGSWREVARWGGSKSNVLLPGGGVASQLAEKAWEIHLGHAVRVLAGVEGVVASAGDALMIDAAGLWRLSGGKRHRLHADYLGDLAGVDRTGNPLFVENGEGALSHWSPRGGVRVLLSPSATAE